MVSLSEKWGGVGRANGKMKRFQSVLTECGLSDLGFRGPKYTWSNCQENQALIKEQLDKGVANLAWCEMFPAAEVWVNFSWNSDHALLILQLSRPKHGRRKRNRFRYEASWALENEYKDLIASAWGRHSGLVSGWDSIQKKLSRCKGYSIRWQQHKNGPIQTSIKTLQNRLNFLQGEEGDSEGSETKMVKKELQLLLDQEELKWRQRAKTDRLKQGDRNTKFFHVCAS